MTLESNKALVRRLFEEVFPAADLSALRELVAEEIIDHDPLPGQPAGRAGVEYVVTALHTAQPDQRFTVSLLLAEEDLVAARWTATGTSTGPMLGQPPTGRPVQHTAVVVLRIAHGQVIERWAGFSPVRRTDDPTLN